MNTHMLCKMAGKVQHVVADAGAFLRNAPLQSIGEKIYTLPDVVNEIKDKATKQRLQVLPYQIIFKQPSSESIHYVAEFAKKTGDYRSLSLVDIKVMALTYQLEKENVGTDHIKSAPGKKAEWHATTRLLEKPTDIAGFYLNTNKSKSRSTSECTTGSSVDPSDVQSEIQNVTVEESTSHDTKNIDSTKTDKSHDTNIDVDSIETSDAGKKQDSQTKVTDKNDLKTNVSETNDNLNTDSDEQKEKVIIEVKGETESKTDSHELENITDESDSAMTVNKRSCDGQVLPSNVLEEESDSDDEGIDDDDDDGWITPGNIKEVKERMGDINTDVADVPVGCLTTDFAIQNVLIQMGLNVISVDGMLIKKAKSYVLRCFACMKITTRVTKQFCPWCGNNTLQKVSMTVEEDGSIRYFLSRRKPVTARGTKYPLPMPKGGKHGNNPILFEDQPLPQQRMSKKARQRMDALDPDYIAGSSPFHVNDITSRASQLGIHGGKSNAFNRKNPNEVRKHYGRRK